MGFDLRGSQQFYPKLIMRNVQKIASGVNHLVLLSKNKVYTMGCGDEGQLGRICKRHSNRESRIGRRKYYKKYLYLLYLISTFYILQNYC